MTTPPLHQPLTVRIPHIDHWDPCDTPPEVGAVVTGTLAGSPTAHPRSSVRVNDWDRDRDVIAFDGGVACWDPAHGNPFERDVDVRLWPATSDAGEPGAAVAVTATVTDMSHLYVRTGRGAATDEFLRPVSAVDTSPRSLVTPAGVFEPDGVLVTLADAVFTEPTIEQVARVRAAQERYRRTLFVIAPAAQFGTMVPDVGERIGVDLADPAVDIRHVPDGTTGIVTGIVDEVSKAVDCGVYTALARVAPGTPTAEVDNDLFVALVLDGPS